MWQSLWGFVQFFYPVLLLRWAFTHVAWLWVFGGGERCLGGGGASAAEAATLWLLLAYPWGRPQPAGAE